MTLAAEQVIKEIEALPLEDRLEIWQQLSRLVVERPASSANEAEFDAALDEVTGCTAGRDATSRLLEERRHDRQRELDYLQSRTNTHSHA